MPWHLTRINTPLEGCLEPSIMHDVGDLEDDVILECHDFALGRPSTWVMS
jgi:hypothetical protein